jgi:hypothetical protein
MTHRRRVLGLLAGIGIGGANYSQAGPQGIQRRSSEDHAAWVAEALQRMEAIKPGMTRGVLLGVFTTEGGISSRWERRFVSRDCRYFKVDVKFEQAGEVTSTEDSRDIIHSISRPYLQFSIGD